MALNDHKPIENLAMVVLETLSGHDPRRAASLEYHAVRGNYYALLGLERASRRNEISLALQKHRQCTESLSLQVVEALDNAELVLLNSALRARYDASLD